MKKQLHCQNCGIRIKPNSKFCEGCGERFEEENENYKNETAPFSKRYPDYVKRVLEIFILLNVISVMFSVYINWHYLYSLSSLMNVSITCVLSLINIIFLIQIYHGKSGYVFSLSASAFLAFILVLGGFILTNALLICILEFLVLYYIIFWLKHPIK